MTPDQFNSCGGCVELPWALSATAVMYNLPGLPNNLHITGPIIAGIYLGQIKKWNDPKIKAVNKGVNLPSPRRHPGLPERLERHDRSTSPRT